MPPAVELTPTIAAVIVAEGTGQMQPGDWVQAILMALLIGITGFYAWQTRNSVKAMEEAAKAAETQAEATSRMAEEILTPVIEQWIREYPLPHHQGQPAIIEVKYKNTGGGPPVDLKWFLYSNGECLLAKQSALGTSGDQQPQVKFNDVPSNEASAGLRITAEYAGVFGGLWRSSLTLVPETKGGKRYLVNGTFNFERISQRASG